MGAVSDDLVDPEELAALLGHPRRPVVLDVRWSVAEGAARDEYAVGHLPGAVFVDLDRDLAGPPGAGGRHPLPDPAALEESMRAWGIEEGDPIVVYDAADATSAARAWWVLRWAGCADVRVLDGGIAAWRRRGRPIEATVPTPVRGDVVVRPGGMPILDAQQALRLGSDGVLLDARAPERYAGKVEPIDQIAGHIPGAVNAPTADNVNANGRLRPAADLAARFAAMGVRPGRRVGAYCGSGVTAAHEVLALRIAGIDAALYVGSWSDWVTDPARPVATGRAPG